VPKNFIIFNLFKVVEKNIVFENHQTKNLLFRISQPMKITLCIFFENMESAKNKRKFEQISQSKMFSDPEETINLKELMKSLRKILKTVQTKSVHEIHSETSSLFVRTHPISS
jgi:hypothetical protein